MLGVCLKYTQTNYGSKLQALATIKMIENLSIDYEIIRYDKKSLGFYIRSLPRFLNWVFLNDRYDQLQRYIEFKRNPEIKRSIDIRNCAFESFDKHFLNNLSKVYKNYDCLKKECSQRYDRVMTCSDQLWSPAALGSGFYNLMFAPESMEKISWASSFGVSNIPWYQKERTRKYLNRIEHISMREKRGAEIVKELTGREVPVLIDPVFMLSKEEWDDLIPLEKPEFENYIFCYFLGSNREHRTIAEEFAKKMDKKIVTLRHLDRYNAGDEDFGDIAPYDVDPNRFLSILRNADCVFTDSFHGMSFSVIFEKKFVVFDRYDNSSSNSKNSRIDSLCSILNLSKLRFSNGADIFDIVQHDIDYSSIKSEIAKYQQRTIDYLMQAFELD